MDRLASLPCVVSGFVTVDHLIAALAKRSTLPSFAEARASAIRSIGSNPSIAAVVTLTLRADDRVELIRFGSRGGATVVALIG